MDVNHYELNEEQMQLVCRIFDILPENVTNVCLLSKGMTNRLIRFRVKEQDYILREPGEGSNELTDRQHEADVYAALEGTGITEHVKYISGTDGYKIAEFLDGVRECDVEREEDVALCMEHIRRLHDMRITVDHEFDLIAMLEHYEELRGRKSVYTDYEQVRTHVVELIGILNDMSEEHCLCHIDPVSDNLLIKNHEVTLIDWEYAGMSERHIDIAMFCIYADYDRNRMDWATDLYFQGQTSDLDRFKVYAYAAVSGMIWAVWSEYKAVMGVNYDEYAMKQYGYARDFYGYAMDMIKKCQAAGCISKNKR